MTVRERFLAYAVDFEKTILADDWSRLVPHLSAALAYEVRNASFACSLQGRDSVLYGIRTSLEGLDRRVDARIVSHHGEPIVRGRDLEVDWLLAYQLEGAPELKLAGTTHATIEADGIVRMIDWIDEESDRAVSSWIANYAHGLDLSYTRLTGRISADGVVKGIDGSISC